MGKTLLIDTSPIPANPTTSHCRTIQEISRCLGLELISTAEELQDRSPADYSVFAVMGSAFYPKTAEIEAFIRRAHNPHIIWLNNEHTCSPNSEYARLIKDYDSTVISNVVEKGNKVKGYDKFVHLNLNCLLVKERNQLVTKKYGMLYYGTYRPGRRLYFQKYFADQDDFILSSKTKNLRKFHQLAGCNCQMADSPDWTPGRESFNLVRNTIYLEDELMHVNFNFLSNRFYEALFCNVIQFFDGSCRGTVEQHGLYSVDDFLYVNSKAELLDKLKFIAYNQTLWYHQFNELRRNADRALDEKNMVLKELNTLLHERP